MEGEIRLGFVLFVYIRCGFRTELGLLGFGILGDGPYNVSTSENRFTEVDILR